LIRATAPKKSLQESDTARLSATLCRIVAEIL